ncbi:MAG: methyltransferase domain-containing protein [Stackebrandtia sp.]
MMDKNGYARRPSLNDLAGTVLEIGAGRGANFERFAEGIDWIGLEPKRRRRTALRAAAIAYGHGHGHAPKILAAPAEAIPLADGCVDAVASTIVLCSVRDLDASLAEVIRVLRPGGRFVFFEHVAAPPGTRTHRWQRVWAPVSRRVDNGCDPARDIAAAIRSAGFARVALDTFRQPMPFGLAVPFIAGYAWR